MRNDKICTKSSFEDAEKKAVCIVPLDAGVLVPINDSRCFEFHFLTTKAQRTQKKAKWVCILCKTTSRTDGNNYPCVSLCPLWLKFIYLLQN